MDTFCMEGGNELSAFYLLRILATSGLVKRFKAQPFELTAHANGIGGIPDFMFEWYDGTQVVAEIKSSRYYTVERAMKADQMAKYLEQFKLKYVVWTSAAHLTTALWQNLRQIDKEHVFVPTEAERALLASELTAGPVTIEMLIRNKCSQQLILFEASHGRAHFDMTRARDRSTLIGLQPNVSHYGHLLRATPSTRPFWQTLKRR